MALPALTVSFRPRDMGLVDEACRITTGCGSSELVTAVAAVLVGIFFAIFLAVALDRVREARSVVREERDRASAERDAFETFADRVGEIEATPMPSAESAGEITAVAVTPSDGRFERVREAYRETVMDVPHYDEEYDEPLEVNMAAELGEEVAAAVATSDRFTPQIKRALVEGGREAARRRADLVAELDRETEALEEATGTLEDVDRRADEAASGVYGASFDALVDRWDRLDELESRCERLLRRRQETIHDGGSGTVADAPTLQEYLYRSLDSTHPVIADATDVLERVREVRRDVLDAITRRA